MLYLCLDTSTPILDCAIISGETILADICKNAGKEHSTVALPAIAELFQRTRLTPQDIDIFVATNGPGSFTGTRIGAAIIQAMAHATAKKPAGISTLELMAWSGADGTVSPIIDARRDAVFNAVYHKTGNTLTEITPPRRIQRAELANEQTIESCEHKWNAWAKTPKITQELKLIYLGGSI